MTTRDAYNGTILWKKPTTNWVTHFFPYKANPYAKHPEIVKAMIALI